MYATRPSSCFPPRPLAAATCIDESRAAFVAARDHYPTAVAGQLLPDAIYTLLPKDFPEDRLLVHEVANVPPGNPCNVQRFRRKPVAIRASLRRSPADPVCEFRLRFVARSLQAIRFQCRFAQTPAVCRRRREEMNVVSACRRMERLHIRIGDFAAQLTGADRTPFPQPFEWDIAW